ncbi:MAG: iron-containing redox enzyme family protein, partial [Sulfurifustaceae bacterium]
RPAGPRAGPDVPVAARGGERASEDLARQFALLAHAEAGEEKTQIAPAICDYLGEIDLGRIATGDRRAVRRLAASATRKLRDVLQCCVDPERHEDFDALQLFVRAGERLFSQIVDVRNFERPAAHALFALIENSVIPQLRHDLHAARPVPRAPRSNANTNTSGFARHAGVSEEALFASCIVMALAQFPVTQFAQIVGFGYATLRTAAVLSLRQPSRRKYRDAWHMLRRALNERGGVGATAEENHALAHGAAIFERCANLLLDATRQTRARTRERAIRIFEQKAQYAMLHHGAQVLGPRRLVDWFSDKPFQAEAMLHALHESRWIDKTDVPASRFFAQLLASGGKMHGVFSASEIEVLQRYFSSFDGETDEPADGEVPARYFDYYERRRRDAAGVEARVDIPVHRYRERYFLLLDDGGAPVLRLARETVDATFAEFASLSHLRAKFPLFDSFVYDAAQLEQRVSQIYWFQGRHAQRMNFDLDEDELRTLHLYFAPFALVDGCWLRNVAAERSVSDAHMALYSIYADEIGNGRIEHNHANIYGALMQELGWNISSVNAPALRADESIPQGAFKAATFLLALNQVHARRFPELLGVTLAIEMSGLDGFYEQMIANLEKYGHTSAIWRLHVSIDNYSSGHSRQSLDAIIHYMQEIRRTHDDAVVELVWNRVWTGFLTMLYLFDLQLQVLKGVKKNGSR